MSSPILLLLLSLANIAVASKNATADNFLQGQGFLGHGLNIMYMNPLVGSNNIGGAPEGLTKAQSVIEFTPSDHTVKWNGHDYSCPAGVDCDVYSSCGSSSESFSAHGAKSYQEILKRSGGVSFGSTFSWFPGSFTASSSYTSTVSDMEEHSYHYFYAKAACAMYAKYHLKLRDFTADVSVTDEFKAGVAFLSDDDDSTFYRVIEAFGTHYTTAVLIGGQMTKEDWFTAEAVQHAESEGRSFEEMARVSFGIFGGSEQYSTEKQTECKEEYDEKRVGTRELYVGGAAFTEGDIGKWYEALVGDLESVAPIGSGIEIMPISELMTAQYFPDDKDIAGKKDKMEKMLESYCEWLGENGKVCLLKPEDKAPTSDIKTEDLEGGPNNWGAAEVAIGTKVYRFGGWDGSEVSTTSLYDAAMGKWDEAKVQQLPEARGRIGAAAVGDDIFIFGGYDGDKKSEVLKYSTARDSFAVMAPMDKPMSYVTAAAVTNEDGTAKIFYASMIGSGFFVYAPSADKHTVIDADIRNINCLTSSNDGEGVWGLVDKHLYSIDASTGDKTTFSDNEFPSDMSKWWSQCAMASDGFFYFLNDSGIWYMDTAEDGDKKWFKTGVVPSHHISFGYSAVMIQDTLLITSSGYTDAISTTPQARATQRLSLEQ